MRTALVAALSLVILVSGCINYTGDVAINFTGENATSSAGLNPSAHENTSLNETGGATEQNIANLNISETGMDNATSNVSEGIPENTTDPCKYKVCDESITTCPDGTVVTCDNACDSMTGMCTSCIPDCTGHDMECDIQCGTCETPDKKACTCVRLLYCDGNGICEPDNNEWPDGSDCLRFDSCNDNDSCTLDTFDPNRQTCIYTDICCNDSNECTADIFNYSTGECTHIYTCCGNGACEPDNGETTENCPDDCFEEGEESGDVSISSIDPNAEVVVLSGYGIDLGGWSIEDAASNTYNFTSIVINGILRLHSIGDPADNNETDIYWGTKNGGPRTSPIWNNDHDTATLRNSTGGIEDIYTY